MKTTRRSISKAIRERQTFREMLIELRSSLGMTQKEFSASIKFSNQYICDLEHGRRLPSVTIVKNICEWSGSGQKEALHWNIAAARAHGWDV